MKAYTVEFGTRDGDVFRFIVVPHQAADQKFGVVVFGEMPSDEESLPIVAFHDQGFETLVDALKAGADFVAQETKAYAQPATLN